MLELDRIEVGKRLLACGGAHKPKWYNFVFNLRRYILLIISVRPARYDFGAGDTLPLSELGGDGFLRAEFFTSAADS